MSKTRVSTEELASLKNSRAFDPNWYSTAYPDVAQSGLDPAEHFLWIGAKLGRDPLPPATAAQWVADPTETETRQIAPMGKGGLVTLAERGMVLPPLNLDAEKAGHHDLTDERFWYLVKQVHAFTELSVGALFNLYTAVRYIIDAGVPGDLVECGVHMGGSVMLMEHLLLSDKATRRLFALDTFTGFVRRTEDLDVDMRTGTAACLIDQAVDYTAGSTANMESVGFKGLRVIKGDVLETIPTLKIDRISLLRLDTDTYDTTKFELEQLYDRVSPGGVIIVDDYGYTIGCKKAVDDFIVGRKVMLQRINPNVRSWVKVAD